MRSAVSIPSTLSVRRNPARRFLLGVSISALLALPVSAQLQWDPLGGAAGAQGGSGDWLTSNGGSPWWNGVGNVAWINGSDAQFTGTGNAVAQGVIVDDLIFSGSYSVTGTLNLGMGDGMHEISVSNAGNATIYASIAGAEGLVKLNGGTLYLAGANSYSGPVIVSQGKLIATGSNAIGPANSVAVSAGASVVFDGVGQKRIGSLSGAGSVSIGNILEVGADDISTTFSGLIVPEISTGHFVKVGSGTLTLTGAISHAGNMTVDGGVLKLQGTNSYGGNTIVTNGTLEVSGGNALPDGKGIVTVTTPGVLRLMASEMTGPLNGNGSVDIGSNALTIGVGAGNANFSGVISGSGSVTIANFQILAGINTFTGGITVQAGKFLGVPDFGSPGAIGPLGPGPVTLDGGSLQYSGTGTISTDRPFTMTANGGGFSGGSGTLIVDSLLSGPGAVTIQFGTVKLTNSGNSFTGGIRIQNGTLALSDIPDNASASTIGAAGPITIGSGGRLLFTGTGGDSSNRSLVYQGVNSSIIEVGAGASLTLNSATGTGGLVKRGAGTLVQTDPANTFSGRVSIEEGTLQTGPLANAGVPSALGSGDSIIFGPPSANAQLVLPTGINGSTNRSISGTGRIKISNSTITLNCEINGDITYAGDDPNTDTFILNTTYPAPLLNPSTSKTILDRVTIKALANLASRGRVELLDNTGSRLEISAPSTSIGSLQGGGGPNFGRVALNTNYVSIGDDNSDATFAGVIEGTAKLRLPSTGVTSLTGNSTFTGDVWVFDGTLAVASVANAGMASSMGSGTTLELGANLGTSPRGGSLAFTGVGTSSTNRTLLLSGNGAKIIVSNPSSTLVWSGPINGTVPGQELNFTKEGSGTLRLTGSNGYLGVTEIKEGKLQVLSSNALPNSGKVIVSAGSSLELLPGSDEAIGSLEGSGSVILGGQRLITGGNNLPTTFSGVISGVFGSRLEKRGYGTLTLTNSNSTFTGGLNITEGAVTTPSIADVGVNTPIGSDGSITLGDSEHTGRLIVTNFGTVSSNRPISVAQGGGIIEPNNTEAEVVIAGSITGMGSLVKLGAGRLTISGDKAFAGSLVVADGTLRLDGNIAGTPVTVVDPGSLDSSGADPRKIGLLTFAGGTVSPGLPGATGVIETGSISLNSGRFVTDLKSADSAGYDYLNASGGVGFDGIVNLDINLSFDPEDHVDVFRIIVNDGTDATVLNGESARFAYGGFKLNDGAQFMVESNSFSQLFEVRYGLTAEDNDLRLIAAPEPGTGLLIGLGTLVFPLRRKRRCRTLLLTPVAKCELNSEESSSQLLIGCRLQLGTMDYRVFERK